LLATQHIIDDDPCPIRDEFLARFYSASELSTSGLLAAAPPEMKATLALFCYRRSHLHTIGLTIAASCEEYDLIQAGGTAGAALFARSREARLSAAPILSPYNARRKVTLAQYAG